jgi:ABC-type Fe3+ transport system permease subunit
MALMATTGITAVTIASFYSIGDAGHYMNMYHSLQYLFIVCVLETPLIAGKIKLPKINKKLLLVTCGVGTLSIAFAAGLARLLDQFSFLGNFWLLSSLCHFWYDGFIWSVRKNDV